MAAKKRTTKQGRSSAKTLAYTRSRLQPTAALTVQTRSFHEILSAIDWKESYVSLSLGMLVVAVLISFVLLFAKGKSLNFITTHHTSQISKAKVQNKPVVLSGKSYTVQDGDNLAIIAASFYGSEDDWVKIAQANKLDNPDIIVPGQQLQIPR